MRVLVCGGRNFTNKGVIHSVLDEARRHFGMDCLIEGDAPGADRLAGFWARRWRLNNIKFPADWKAHGRAAGPIRNQRMIDEGRPNLVVAFPGGKGTADMIARARKAGIEVREVPLPHDVERSGVK